MALARAQSLAGDRFLRAIVRSCEDQRLLIVGLLRDLPLKEALHSTPI